MKRIGNAALGRTAFPNLNFQKAVGGTPGVSDFEFQWERTSKLKYAVKADARFDRYFGVTERREKKTR
jgi:hypothetical protein